MIEATVKELVDSFKETDLEIVRLLNRRARISREIGESKAHLGGDVYDPSQEQRIYEYLAEMNEGDLPVSLLRAIFSEIISASRVLQSPVTVAYLGPEASFAHMAAKSHFGASSQFYPQTSIAGVFREVEKRKIKWGVVPIENSIEGSVNLTLDKLITTTLHIRAEVLLRIRHCLLTKHENMAEINKVYSHPQALAQCQEWLRANLPQAALVEMESTAAAAQKVAKEGSGAAIGSKAAATIYELSALLEGIEDNSSNTTRFLVIGEGEGKSTGKDKTSLLFGTPHEPGALYRVLQSFSERGINMMKIESHPVKDRLWEYLFFADVAGHYEDVQTKECLDELRPKVTFLNILGSYPWGEDIQ